MSRPRSLAAFFALTVAAFLILVAAWIPLSKWTSYPVAGIAHIVLGNSAKEWVHHIDKVGGKLEIETRVMVQVRPEPNAPRGALVVEVEPAHYAYGLPLFLALLIASRTARWVWKALFGYALLWLPQTFSVVFDVLKQIMVTGGGAQALAISPWQAEGIALGYQVGTLLLPTIAPIAVWLWLDRDFLRSVIIGGWLEKAWRSGAGAGGQDVDAPPAAPTPSRHD